MLSTTQVVAITVVAAAIVAYAQYVFKRNIHKFKFDVAGILSILNNKMVLLGGVVYIIGLVFYLVGLGSGQLSFVYPAFSSTFIFVILISHFKLGEKVGYARLAGILLILIGIGFVSSVI